MSLESNPGQTLMLWAGKACAYAWLNYFWPIVSNLRERIIELKKIFKKFM